MNIQIFGKSKCFETKKAQRYFKERKIKFQAIDLPRFGISRGELKSVVQALGLEAVIDENARDGEILRYLAHNEDIFEKLMEEPRFIKTPIVRNGKQATAGYCPDIWKSWE